MTHPDSIGLAPWRPSEIRESIKEFLNIYKKKPIADNKGGMKAPHMFATWFMLRQLSPDFIVESGVWKGQGTWLIEQACPDAKIVSIDPNLAVREYISPRVEYSDVDFLHHSWPMITDKSVAFFDDHQNAYLRLHQCRWFGFKNVIFEDNYPPGKGDCYSLKKALSSSTIRKKPADSSKFAKKAIQLINRGVAAAGSRSKIQLVSAPNPDLFYQENHAAELKKNLEKYFEFPPVYKPKLTRWGDPWNTEKYPTPEALFKNCEGVEDDIFCKEAQHYTWICLAKLRS